MPIWIVRLIGQAVPNNHAEVEFAGNLHKRGCRCHN